MLLDYESEGFKHLLLRDHQRRICGGLFAGSISRKLDFHRSEVFFKPEHQNTVQIFSQAIIQPDSDWPRAVFVWGPDFGERSVVQSPQERCWGRMFSLGLRKIEHEENWILSIQQNVGMLFGSFIWSESQLQRLIMMTTMTGRMSLGDAKPSISM